MSLSPDIHHIGKIGLVNESYTYEWTLENFSSYNGKTIYSPSFNTCKFSRRQWRLSVNPINKNGMYTDFIDIYIELEYPTSLNASVELVFLSRNKEIVSKQTLKKSFIKGSPTFIGRIYATNKIDHILEDDTLTIIYKISIAKKSDKSFSDLYFLDRENIQLKGKYLINWLQSEKFSDITIFVEGKPFRLHKSVLASQSPIFEAMFLDDMKEKEKSVKIEDITYAVSKELFQYLYSGKVEELERLATDLYVGAQKYQIEELQQLCVRSLCDSLEMHNAFEYLNFAEKYSIEELKSRTIDFIAIRAKDFVYKPEFKLISSDMMTNITRVIVEKVHIFS